jgi:hypothetical protein
MCVLSGCNLFVLSFASDRATPNIKFSERGAPISAANSAGGALKASED